MSGPSSYIFSMVSQVKFGISNFCKSTLSPSLLLQLTLLDAKELILKYNQSWMAQMVHSTHYWTLWTLLNHNFMRSHYYLDHFENCFKHERLTKNEKLKLSIRWFSDLVWNIHKESVQDKATRLKREHNTVFLLLMQTFSQTTVQ